MFFKIVPLLQERNGCFQRKKGEKCQDSLASPIIYQNCQLFTTKDTKKLNFDNFES